MQVCQSLLWSAWGQIPRQDGDPINFVKFPYGQEGGDGAQPFLNILPYEPEFLPNQIGWRILLSLPWAFDPQVSQGLAGLASPLSGNAV